MASPYRVVLSRPGAFAFSATGLVSRLPLSMLGLSIVVVVAGRTDSYAFAGTVSAAYVLAAAATAPLQGRLIDTWGQARVLTLWALGFGTGVILVVAAISGDLAPPLPHLAAVLAGAATPQTGNMVRARWSHLLGDPSTTDPRELNTAFALEAVLDEVVFIVGPVLATWVTLQVHEFAGIALAGVAGTFGSLALALQHATAPPVVRRAAGPRVPLDRRVLVPVVVASIGIGVIFGAAEVVVVALTQEQGRPGLAGVMLAIWAAGSLGAGVVVGLTPAPPDVVRRLRTALVALTLSFVPLTLLPQLEWVAVCLLVGGAAISPTLVAAVHLVRENVPAARLTEALSWTTLGLSVGVAPGAALSGWVVDHAWNASAGFLVPLVAGVVATGVALSLRLPERSDALRH
ncbi:MAG: MFS transporter [Aeromicrobium sp.]|uniref:MFS transporter n=1 Tax=Aeromicrobium sp. TaxID=1871063 RepID=UPI0026290816|nr:MFS transporter [Aeromicrobium sp.]MDF1705513.1 MFS transporter [Aeromicrobium sp.]